MQISESPLGSGASSSSRGGKALTMYKTDDGKLDDRLQHDGTYLPAWTERTSMRGDEIVEEKCYTLGVLSDRLQPDGTYTPAITQTITGGFLEGYTTIMYNNGMRNDRILADGTRIPAYQVYSKMHGCMVNIRHYVDDKLQDIVSDDEKTVEAARQDWLRKDEPGTFSFYEKGVCTDRVLSNGTVFAAFTGFNCDGEKCVVHLHNGVRNSRELPDGTVIPAVQEYRDHFADDEHEGTYVKYRSTHYVDDIAQNFVCSNGDILPARTVYGKYSYFDDDNTDTDDDADTDDDDVDSKDKEQIAKMIANNIKRVEYHKNDVLSDILADDGTVLKYAKIYASSKYWVVVSYRDGKFVSKKIVSMTNEPIPRRAVRRSRARMAAWKE